MKEEREGRMPTLSEEFSNLCLRWREERIAELERQVSELMAQLAKTAGRCVELEWEIERLGRRADAVDSALR